MTTMKKTTTTTEYPPSPEDRAWFISRVFFLWQSPMFAKAAALSKEGKALEHDDLIPLPHMDHATTIGPKFETKWAETATAKATSPLPSKTTTTDAEKTAGATPAVEPPRKLSDLNKPGATRSTKRLQHTLLTTMGRQFYLAGLIKFCNTSLQFSYPILLNNIIKFIETAASPSSDFDPDAPWYESKKGYWLSGLLFLAMSGKAITESSYFHMINKCGFRAKMAVSVATYQKSLRLANAERQSTSLGT
jgi:hypothetical protein